MASTHKHIRSSTANKRPTTAIADGQIALNTNASSPGLFFKDSTGASIIKIGPVHVGSTAPNVTPASGGSSGNSTGEVWLDTSLTPNGVKIWNGSAWVNATPAGSTTVQGLLELATSAETQTGSDTDRAVTPAGLQSKVSDSTSTTSSTTIASSTAVKSAYDLANAALPKSGGTVTGNLEIGTTGSLSFEGSTADAFETTIAVTDPTADRTITLPDTTGTVVTTGDSGTVTGTMIASGTVTSSNIVDGTIVDADISASAEIAVSKLADGAARQLLQTDAAGTGVEWASNIDIPGTLDVTSAATFDSTIGASAGTASLPSITFTGDLNTGIYSPGADQVAISTNGANRFQIDSSGNITVDTNTFYVDAANNRVGVGTTSPLQPLHVKNAGSTACRLVLENSGSTAAGSTQIYSQNNDLVFDANSSERARIDSSGRLLVGTSTSSTNDTLVLQGNSAGSTFGAQLRLRRNATIGSGNGIGDINFEDSSGNQYAVISGAGDGTSGSGDYPGRIVFATTADGAPSPTERMRIRSDGKVLIASQTITNANSANFNLVIEEASGFAGGAAYSGSLANAESVQWRCDVGSRGTVLGIYKHSGITNPCAFIQLTAEDASNNFLWADNSDQLRISTTVTHIGTISGTVVGTQTSDERLKNILGPVEYGLNTIKQIEPVRYALKSEPTIEKLGFIAQQMLPLVPQSVFDTNEHIEGEPEDAPTKLGMEYVALIPVLVNAIKELSTEVDALKAQLQGE